MRAGINIWSKSITTLQMISYIRLPVKIEIIKGKPKNKFSRSLAYENFVSFEINNLNNNALLMPCSLQAWHKDIAGFIRDFSDGEFEIVFFVLEDEREISMIFSPEFLSGLADIGAKLEVKFS